MNILFIITLAFIASLLITQLVIKEINKSKNHVHFYVARDKDRSLWLYMGKPVRGNDEFNTTISDSVLTEYNFEYFGLNENDYADLEWEDEPVEVFINMED